MRPSVCSRWDDFRFTNRRQSLHVVLICSSSFLLNPNHFHITDVMGHFGKITQVKIWEDKFSFLAQSTGRSLYFLFFYLFSGFLDSKQPAEWHTTTN